MHLYRELHIWNELAMHTFDANLVSYLPSMLWARTIKYRLGGQSYGKIQKYFLKKDGQTNADFWDSCSGRLYKNSRGKTRVRDKLLINKIEEFLPGTKRILDHPLWKIMANPDSNLNQIYSLMNELSIDLRRKLFKTNNPEITLIRRKLNYKSVNYISKMNDLDAFACILMMIREAELTRHTEAYIQCKWEAHQLFCRIATFEPIKSMAPLIYDYIFKVFIRKNNPLPSHLTNILVKYAPENYRIPKKYPLPRYLDENEKILNLAVLLGVISSSQQDQLNFLYWIDYGISRTQIMEALVTLKNTRTTNHTPTNFPAPLDSLMQRLRGDSRKYITGNYYI